MDTIQIGRKIIWTVREPTIEEIAQQHHWSVTRLRKTPKKMKFKSLAKSTIKIPKRILKRVEVLDPEKRYKWYVGEEVRPDIPWGSIAKAAVIACGVFFGAIAALVLLTAFIAFVAAFGGFILAGAVFLGGFAVYDPCLVAVTPEGVCYSVWRRWDLI